MKIKNKGEIFIKNTIQILSGNQHKNLQTIYNRYFPILDKLVNNNIETF